LTPKAGGDREGELDARFSSPGAKPTEWPQALIEGTWFGLGDPIRAGDVLLYRATPTTVFGFGKGRQFSQTRWRF